MKINEAPKKLKQYTAAYRRKKKWMKAITCLAAVVVFCTVYALILPAITLDKDHILQCSHTVHQHNNECYNEDGALKCGYADYVVHTHQGDYCYDENGNLVCELPEVKGHQHDASCYEEQSTLVCGKEESSGHMHDESCYTRVQGDLICTDEEHEHTDECYAWTEELTCGKEEGEGAHQHSDECYKTNHVLICEEKEGVLHQHSADCYDENGNLTCGMLQVEEHQHSDACIITPATDNSTEVKSQENATDSSTAVENQENATDSSTAIENKEDGADDSTEAKDKKDETEDNTASKDKKDGTDSIAMSKSINGVPDEVLKALADEYGVYPGTTKDGRVWTAYDAASETDASIKATVTLPEGKSAAENHYLYIRKVEENDPYHPSEEALDQEVGRRNGVATYAIHWVHIYQDENGEWKYNPQTTSVLDETNFATIKIDCLKESAYIAGKQANRKLMVYNSRQEDGSELEGASNTLIDVTATDDAYTGFTFQTNRGGPYVFASKYLFDGYVSSLTIDTISDGVAPFDEDDNAGNDSGNDNRIIRTYDNIQYGLTANFGARSNVSTEKTAQMHFEMTLEADITDAIIDMGQMLWLGNDYTLEYLDEAGNVVLTQKADGKYYDKEGKEISLNDIVSDSTKGEKSYTTNITQQRLRGQIDLQADQNLLAGNRTLSAAVQVLNANNGSIIQPTFRAWFDGNEDNYGSESAGEGNGVTLAEKVTDNEKKSDEIKVSASARFNLELAKNSNMSYKGWFDSSKGKEVNNANKDSYTVGNATVTGGQLYTLLEQLAALDENIGRSNPEEFTDKDNVCSAYLQGQDLSAYASVFKNIRYGRITGYGIGVQLYNEASGDQNVSSKGFKGVSLPQGDISFDLDLQTSVKSSGANIDPAQYYSQIWEYNENVNSGTGNQGKNMDWANLASTRYVAWAAPYNGTKEDNQSACYTGGSWSLSGENHFTISGYDLNFLSTGPKFPTHKAGNSAPTTGYNTYIGCFSAGYVQVLNVMPRYYEGTLNMGTQVTVKNLAVSTIDGQSISTDGADETGYAHETNTKDNSLTDDIPLYARGGMTKANAFGKIELFDRRQADFASKEYFLGTDFWGTSYDSSAFAGQQITLVGAARINAGDYQIRHMNILQLFDSEVLSIIDGKQPYVMSRIANIVEGDTTILYAADPDYKDGYNTNDEDVMKYMSTVREEDLIYYESLEALEADGYTCIGVMAELRNWTISGEGGYSTVLKIAMDVSQEEKFLNQTVGTVNTVRIWTNANDMQNGTVSWKNGVYDDSTGKNSVAGYTSMSMSSDEHYCGQVANGTPYEKAEYKNGQVVLGSNTGGYVYGNTLLVLGYKSEVDIEVENGGNTELPSYDLDQGNNTVNYRLKDIIARTEDKTGSAQDTKTNLTVLSKLDINREDGVEQRIAVAANTYCMEPASDLMVLLDENGNKLEKQSVDISSDANNPTTVYYAFLDESTKEIDPSQKYEIQVYAERDTNGTQVIFELIGATVDVNVPDITYDASILPDAANNNDKITAAAYINGTSDVRAYSTTAGNMDEVEIGIVRLGSTRLVKSVDMSYIELDGTFTYTVTYTNGGSTPVSLYLYDLLPNTNDIRESEYQGNVLLRAVDASIKGEDNNFTADIDFYFSKMKYDELYNMVKVFGEKTAENGEEVDNSNEARKARISTMLQEPEKFNRLGSLNEDTEYEFQRSDYFNGMTKEQIEEEMRDMTGIYAVIQNLGGGKSLSIELTVQAKGNKAGDLYRNIANSWLGDDSSPLTSNRVETAALSRTISGVVWDDANFNGVRDDKEQLVPGVICTLFKWDEKQEKYVVCTNDVTGAEIQPITTGNDGAYTFEKLGAGDYIVAFSGFSETQNLKKYVGATTYRTNGTNDRTTNDAVALSQTKGKWDTEVSGINGIDGNEYKYAIAYNLNNDTGVSTASLYTRDNAKVNGTPLHTIQEILDNNIPMTNDVELYQNLDCGLVIASYELPKTGGSGTTVYIVGGLLIISASLLLLYKNKKHRKEDSATY